MADIVTLIARLDVESVQWLSTSMGGLIGMVLAAQPAGLIRSLVLNDIGPVLDATAMARIGEYIGQDLCPSRVPTAVVISTTTSGLRFTARR